jgi:hypothetical protein
MSAAFDLDVNDTAVSSSRTGDGVCRRAEKDTARGGFDELPSGRIGTSRGAITSTASFGTTAATESADGVTIDSTTQSQQSHTMEE